MSGLIAAAGEAMTNAARHAGVSEIDVYGESTSRSLAVYVRDRGSGFDPESLPPDRRGVKSSILERIAGLGGEATVKSSSGTGTEWTMTVPAERTQSDAR